MAKRRVDDEVKDIILPDTKKTKLDEPAQAIQVSRVQPYRLGEATECVFRWAQKGWAPMEVSGSDGLSVFLRRGSAEEEFVLTMFATKVSPTVDRAHCVHIRSSAGHFSTALVIELDAEHLRRHQELFLQDSDISSVAAREAEEAPPADAKKARISERERRGPNGKKEKDEAEVDEFLESEIDEADLESSSSSVEDILDELEANGQLQTTNDAISKEEDTSRDEKPKEEKSRPKPKDGKQRNVDELVDIREESESVISVHASGSQKTGAVVEILDTQTGTQPSAASPESVVVASPQDAGKEEFLEELEELSELSELDDDPIPDFEDAPEIGSFVDGEDKLDALGDEEEREDVVATPLNAPERESQHHASQDGPLDALKTVPTLNAPELSLPSYEPAIVSPPMSAKLDVDKMDAAKSDISTAMPPTLQSALVYAPPSTETVPLLPFAAPLADADVMEEDLEVEGLMEVDEEDKYGGYADQMVPEEPPSMMMEHAVEEGRMEMDHEF